MLAIISNCYNFALIKLKRVCVRQISKSNIKMNLEQRKKIYNELKEFDKGVKNVADSLGFTSEHIRMVMTRIESHASSEKIVEASLLEIKSRRDKQSERLQKIFSLVV